MHPAMLDAKNALKRQTGKVSRCNSPPGKGVLNEVDACLQTMVNLRTTYMY